MSDDADNSELEREALIVHGLERLKLKPRPHPTCEECQDVKVMVLKNGVFARYCADCWEHLKPAPLVINCTRSPSLP